MTHATRTSFRFANTSDLLIYVLSDRDINSFRKTYCMLNNIFRSDRTFLNIKKISFYVVYAAGYRNYLRKLFFLNEL